MLGFRPFASTPNAGFYEFVVAIPHQHIYFSSVVVRNVVVLSDISRM